MLRIASDTISGLVVQAAIINLAIAGRKKTDIKMKLQRATKWVDPLGTSNDSHALVLIINT